MVLAPVVIVECLPIMLRLGTPGGSRQACAAGRGPTRDRVNVASPRDVRRQHAGPLRVGEGSPALVAALTTRAVLGAILVVDSGGRECRCTGRWRIGRVFPPRTARPTGTADMGKAARAA